MCGDAGLDFMNTRLENIAITAAVNIEFFSSVHDHLVQGLIDNLLQSPNLEVGTVFVFHLSILTLNYNQIQLQQLAIARCLLNYL
jgi:hypothetical protein